jgi:hypothetical protein
VRETGFWQITRNKRKIYRRLLVLAVDLNIKVQRNEESVARVLPTLRWTLVALAVAAIAELLVWRTFSRIGVFIPKSEGSVMKTVYTISVQLGTILLNFAVILAIASLLLSFWRFRAGGELGDAARGQTALQLRRNMFLRVAAVASLVVLFASLMLLALVQNTLTTTTIRLALLVAFSALAADMWLRVRDWRMRLFTALMLAGYYLQLIAKLLHDLLGQQLGLGWQETLYEPMLMAGELAVILNGLVAFLAFTSNTSRKRGVLKDMLAHPRSLIGAIALVAVFLFLTFITVAESYIVPILGLYALGYGMHWPLPFYVISLFFFLYTVFYCLGEWKRGSFYRATGLGLILLFAGGYTFQISDQYLFALVGVFLLARPELMESNE